jgi:hypothetical protein
VAQSGFLLIYAYNLQSQKRWRDFKENFVRQLKPGLSWR